MLPIEAIRCPVYFFSLCEVKSVSMVFSVFLAKICILYRSVLLKSYRVRGWARNMSQNLLIYQINRLPSPREVNSMQLDQRDLNARGHVCIYK